MAEPGPDHWFEPLADHLGSAYLRYSFTKGTANEVAFLIDVLGLGAGSRVLDVGCGPGRHARALAERGIVVLGVDISQRFVELARQDAPAGATFERLDARALPFDAEFDAVISLCQGAFGLAGHPGARVDLDGRRSRRRHPGRAWPGPCVRAGGLAVSAFSAYFQVRFLEDTDTFDAATGVNHERTTLKDERRRRRRRTTCGRPASRPGSCGCWPGRPAWSPSTSGR